MNVKTLAAALALPVLLAACAPEVESTIYLADVMKAVESGESVSVPAVLRVPQSGEDECKEGYDSNHHCGKTTSSGQRSPSTAARPKGARSWRP